jgi:hypothetical protein
MDGRSDPGDAFAGRAVMKLQLVLALASIGLACPALEAPVFAQALPHADDVRSAVDSLAKDEGAGNAFGEVYLRRVKDHGAILTSLSIPQDQGVLIAGACDDECSDIDLVVFGEDGEVVEQDIEDSDTPTIRLRPGKQQDFMIELRMLRCSEERCTAGVGLYGLESAAEAARRSNEAAYKAAQSLFGN